MMIAGKRLLIAGHRLEKLSRKLIEQVIPEASAPPIVNSFNDCRNTNTSQNAQTKQTNMQNCCEKSGWLAPLIVGFILGLVTHGLTGLRDRKSRLRIFCGKIEAIKAKITDSGEENSDAILDESRSLVRAECATILYDIGCRKKPSFTSTLAYYCDGIKKEEYTGTPGSMIRNWIYHNQPQPSDKDPRSRKQKMIDALQRLIDCAR